MEKDKKAEIIELLGEGFHTAFRKAVHGEKAHQIWKLIQELDEDEWAAVLEFVYDCIKDSL